MPSKTPLLELRSCYKWGGKLTAGGGFQVNDLQQFVCRCSEPRGTLGKVLAILHLPLLHPSCRLGMLKKKCMLTTRSFFLDCFEGGAKDLMPWKGLTAYSVACCLSALIEPHRWALAYGLEGHSAANRSGIYKTKLKTTCILSWGQQGLVQVLGDVWGFHEWQTLCFLLQWATVLLQAADGGLWLH